MSKYTKLEAGLKNLFSKPASAPDTTEAPAPEPRPAPEPAAKTPPPAPEIPAPAPDEGGAKVTARTAPSGDTDIETASENEVQLVIFKLADEYYGLDVGTVDSIIKMQVTTIIPHAFDYVEGVTNLRGTVLPVVDLRTRFGMEQAAFTKNTRVVVVMTGSDLVGLVVDAVTEVLHISQKSIEPPSFFVASLDSAYIVGIAKMKDRLITLLDLDRIFTRQDAPDKTAA